MTWQSGLTPGSLQRPLSRLWILHRNNGTSTTIWAWVLGGTLLCAAAYGYVPGHCQARALQDERKIALLKEEGITASAQSHLSISKTSKVLDIHVLTGQVLLHPPQGSHFPVVVTAGSARISPIDAAACVGVRSELTVIAVLHGALDISVLRADGESQHMDRIPLRAGDRVELTRMRDDVAVRFASGEPVDLTGCADGILRWAQVGR